MQRKPAIVILISGLVLAIFAVLWVIPNRSIARFPDGETLTLADITYGTNAQPVPDSNPLKSSWHKLKYSVLGSSVLITNQLPYVRTSKGTAVFWFRKGQGENLQSNIAWIPVLETTNQAKPTAAIGQTIRIPNFPDIVGVIWEQCPTNKKSLLLLFHRHTPSPKGNSYFNTNDLDPSNFIAQVSLINPAYQK